MKDKIPKKMKYAYYVGCAAENFTKELDISTRAVCAKLGIELVDVPEFACCGAGVIENQSEILHLTINARNFALAEKKGLDMMVTCSTCLVNMLKVKKRLAENKELLDLVSKNLKEEGLVYKGKATVTHILWVLVRDYGVDKISEKIVRPLKGSIAPYYGCHILRPSAVLGFESPHNPQSIDRVLEACGADVVDFQGKTDCCGFHTVAVNQKPSMKMAAHVLDDAKIQGAEAIVAVCPFCHASLDAYQPESLALLGKKYRLPIFHLTQFVGLALGLTGHEVGLNKNVIPADGVFAEIEKLQL